MPTDPPTAELVEQLCLLAEELDAFCFSDEMVNRASAAASRLEELSKLAHAKGLTEAAYESVKLRARELDTENAALRARVEELGGQILDLRDAISPRSDSVEHSIDIVRAIRTERSELREHIERMKDSPND